MALEIELLAIMAAMCECEEKIRTGEISVERLARMCKNGGTTAVVTANGQKTINMLKDKVDNMYKNVSRMKLLKQTYPDNPDVCALAPRVADCFLTLIGIWYSLCEALLTPDEWRMIRPELQESMNEAPKIVADLLEQTSDNTVTVWFGLNVTKLRGGIDGARLILDRAMVNNRIDVIEKFMSYGFKVDERDHRGETCMYVAAYNGGLEAMKWLREKHGLSINEPRNDGDVPICIAAGNGHVKMVEWLLDKGVDINTRGQHGNTPMHQAALNGRIDVMRYLYGRGADIYLRNELGFSPMESAISNNRTKSMKCLVNELGMDVETPGPNGCTAIFTAAIGKIDGGGMVDCIKYLVKELGANVNARDKDGSTPMFWAAQLGKVDSILCLFGLGADVNERNNYKCTPMFLAAGNGQIKSIGCLAGMGADVNAKDMVGCTPMFPAAFGGHVESIQCLAGLGADVNVKAENGMTPIELAENAGKTECVKCLRELGAK